MLQDYMRAKELQRQYLREWRRRNRDKVREYNEQYWLRKAQKESEAKSNE